MRRPRSSQREAVLRLGAVEAFADCRRTTFRRLETTAAVHANELRPFSQAGLDGVELSSTLLELGPGGRARALASPDGNGEARGAKLTVRLASGGALRHVVVVVAASRGQERRQQATRPPD